MDLNIEFLGILAGGEANPMTLPLVFFILGLIVNIVKVCLVESVSLRQYFLTHKGRTTVSASSLLGTFYLLYSTYPDGSWLMFIFAGYCVDSLINKPPLTVGKVSKNIIH